MKINFCLFLFFWVALNASSQEYVLQFEGTYKGDNIFIQNPFSDSAKKYCTKYIKINDIEIHDSLDRTAYEIRLDTLKIAIGDPVEVTIFRHTDCIPKILNAMPVTPPEYEMQKVSVDETGVLKWTAEKESEKFIYTIQQYIWNKWVKVATVEGIGSKNNFYTYVPLMHSGENKFRIKQTSSTGKNLLSKTVIFNSKQEPLKIKSTRINESIDFTRETRYELYNHHGDLIESGVADKIDTSELPGGVSYYLNFDNQQIEVTKH